jgi:pilus assembly protein CpaE
MIRNIQVLIAGRSDEGLQAIQAAIATVTAVDAESLLMVNGNTDPLLGMSERPDVLILHSSSDIARQLQSLSERPQGEMPELLIFGENLPPEAVKFAVRAGARDLVSEEDPGALARALSDLALELNADDAEVSNIVAVINAKGGSGGTFIACNIAHLAAENSSGDTLIVDLDFQFASLPYYFDLAPKRSLLDALSHVNELDRVAIEAYTAEHASGLRIMAPLPETQSTTDFDITQRIQSLLPILKSRFRHVVFDVPRHIDEVSSPILQNANQVLIVLQQSLPSVRDAVRLKTTLVRDMGIDDSKVHAVVNRHLKSGSIELQDIEEALGEEQLLLVPNHFKAVGQSIDMGVPISEIAPTSPVVKALSNMQARFLSEPSSGSQAIRSSTAIERLKQWSPF